MILLAITIAGALLPMDDLNKFIFGVKEEELDPEEYETAKYEFTRTNIQHKVKPKIKKLKQQTQTMTF